MDAQPQGTDALVQKAQTPPGTCEFNLYFVSNTRNCSKSRILHYRYQTVLSHSGDETPWVIDAHVYEDSEVICCLSGWIWFFLNYFGQWPVCLTYYTVTLVSDWSCVYVLGWLSRVGYRTRFYDRHDQRSKKIKTNVFQPFFHAVFFSLRHLFLLKNRFAAWIWPGIYHPPSWHSPPHTFLEQMDRRRGISSAYQSLQCTGWLGGGPTIKIQLHGRTFAF